MPAKGRLFRRRQAHEKISEEQIDEKLVELGFYERYLKGSWDHDHRLKGVKDYVLKEFLWDKGVLGEQKVGLYLHGTLGIGKSTLIGLIAQGMMKNLIIDVRYSTVERVLDLYTEGQYAAANKLRDAGVLFLDDLAWENAGTGEFRMSKLVELFKYRYGREKPTFVASNLTIDDLSKKAGDHVGYSQIASLLRDKQWIKEYNYGYKNSDSKRIKR